MSIRKQYDSRSGALKTALVEMGQNAAEAVETRWKRCAPPTP